RRLDPDGVADLLADQRAGQGGEDRDAPRRRIGLVRPDDLVAHLLAVLAAQEHRRAERHPRAPLRRVDHLRGGDLRLELPDAPLDEALALLGRVVLGVLREIPVRARLGDRLDDAGPLLALELLELLLEPGVALPGHRSPLRHRSVLASEAAGPRDAGPARVIVLS